MHGADDPRRYVSDVVEATETDDGLAIKALFDLDTEFGKSAYRNTKGRRVSGLSIGYALCNSTTTAAGNEQTDPELIEVSIVAWRPMTRALVLRCNAGVKADQRRMVPPGSRAGNHEHGSGAGEPSHP